MPRIPLRNYSDYFFENIAATGGGAQNQLQITSRCHSQCIFCSNEQNPFEIGRLQFRDINEIKKVLHATYDADYFVLNESLPGRLSEGEAVTHPKFFEILQLIRNKFPNAKISFATIGSLLTPEFINKLSLYKPVSVMISCHSITKENWMNITHLKEHHFHNMINAFGLLQRFGIEVNASIVALPTVNGWEDMEKTISFFASHNIKEITLWRPGYTKYTPHEKIQDLQCDKYELSTFRQKMMSKYNIKLTSFSDPNAILHFNVPTAIDILNNLWYQNIKKVYWVTSTSSYDRLCKIFKKLYYEVPIEVEVIPLKNHTYGGNIECTGLFTVEDFKIILPTLENQTVVIPSDWLDAYGYDLQSENMLEYVETLNNVNIIYAPKYPYLSR